MLKPLLLTLDFVCTWQVIVLIHNYLWALKLTLRKNHFHEWGFEEGLDLGNEDMTCDVLIVMAFMLWWHN